MRNIKITRPMRGRTDTQAQLDENNLPVEESRNSAPLNITRAAKPKPPTSEMTPREALQGMPEIMGGPVSTQGFDVDLKNVDLPIYADSNIEAQLERDQSAFGLFANTIARGASTVVLGGAEALSYFADAENIGMALQEGEKDYSNWFADLMEKAQEEVREVSPIYRSERGQQDFAWDSATWWANNIESIATTASMFIPTAGIMRGLSAAGKASRGLLNTTRIANVAQDASKITKGLNKLVYGEKAESLLRTGTSATISRYMENTMEANETFNSVYQELLAEGVSDQEARLKAGEAAANTWKANWINIATDLVQYGSLTKGLNYAAPAAKGLRKQLAKGGYDYLKNAAGEGLEEFGQYVISQESARAAKNDRSFFELEGLDRRLSDYVKDPEAQASALLGAVGGTFFKAAGSTGQLYNRLAGVYEAQDADLAKRTFLNQLNVTNSYLVDGGVLMNQAVQYGNAGKFSSLKSFYQDLADKTDEQLEAEGLTPKQIEDKRKKDTEILSDLDFLEREYSRLTEDASKDNVIKIQELGSLYEKHKLAQANDVIAAEKTEIEEEISNQIDTDKLSVKNKEYKLNSYKKYRDQYKEQVGKKEGSEGVVSYLDNKIEQLEKEIAEEKQRIEERTGDAVIPMTSRDVDLANMNDQEAYVDLRQQESQRVIQNANTVEGKAELQKEHEQRQLDITKRGIKPSMTMDAVRSLVNEKDTPGHEELMSKLKAIANIAEMASEVPQEGSETFEEDFKQRYRSTPLLYSEIQRMKALAKGNEKIINALDKVNTAEEFYNLYSNNADVRKVYKDLTSQLQKKQEQKEDDEINYKEDNYTEMQDAESNEPPADPSEDAKPAEEGRTMSKLLAQQYALYIYDSNNGTVKFIGAENNRTMPIEQARKLGYDDFISGQRVLFTKEGIPVKHAQSTVKVNGVNVEMFTDEEIRALNDPSVDMLGKQLIFSVPADVDFNKDSARNADDLLIMVSLVTEINSVEKELKVGMIKNSRGLLGSDPIKQLRQSIFNEFKNSGQTGGVFRSSIDTVRSGGRVNEKFNSTFSKKSIPPHIINENYLVVITDTTADNTVKLIDDNARSQLPKGTDIDYNDNSKLVDKRGNVFILIQTPNGDFKPVRMKPKKLSQLPKEQATVESLIDNLYEKIEDPGLTNTQKFAAIKEFNQKSTDFIPFTLYYDAGKGKLKEYRQEKNGAKVFLTGYLNRAEAKNIASNKVMRFNVDKMNTGSYNADLSKKGWYEVNIDPEMPFINSMITMHIDSVPDIKSTKTQTQPTTTEGTVDIPVNDMTIVYNPQTGEMTFKTTGGTPNETVSNKALVRYETTQGTLRRVTYNNTEYAILSDDRIISLSKTSAGKEVYKTGPQRNKILEQAGEVSAPAQPTQQTTEETTTELQVPEKASIYETDGLFDVEYEGEGIIGEYLPTYEAAVKRAQEFDAQQKAAEEGEVISKKEFDAFINNGTVDQARINTIADKIVKGEGLSIREQAILADRTKEVEERIQEVAKQTEENDVSAEEPTVNVSMNTAIDFTGQTSSLDTLGQEPTEEGQEEKKDDDDDVNGNDLPSLRKLREATDPDGSYELWDQEKEVAWFKKNYPNVPLEVLDDLREVVGKGGPELWGMFRNASVFIATNAKTGTLYHEAFHVVFNLMLTDAERQQILEEGATKAKGAVAIEEYWADEYMEYQLSEGASAHTLPAKVADFFKRLWHMIRIAAERIGFASPASMNDYMYRVSRGLYNKGLIRKIGNVKFRNSVTRFRPKEIDNNGLLNAREADVAKRLINGILINDVLPKYKTLLNMPHADDTEIIKAIIKKGIRDNDPRFSVQALYTNVYQFLKTAANDKRRNEKDRKTLGRLLESFATEEDGTLKMKRLYIKAARSLQYYGIRMAYDTGNVETTKDNAEVEDLLEETEDVIENWMVKEKFISAKEKFSQKSKALFSMVPVKNAKFGGFPVFETPAHVFNKLSSRLSDSRNLEDMKRKLDDLINYNPGYKVIRDALNSEDSTIATEFWKNIGQRKFTPFLVLQNDGKRTRTFIGNEQDARKDIKATWQQNFFDSPFYDVSNNIIAPTAKFNEKYEVLSRIVDEVKEDNKKNRLNKEGNISRSQAGDIYNVLKFLNIPVTRNEVIDMFSTPDNGENVKGGKERFLQFASGLTYYMNRIKKGENPYDGNKESSDNFNDMMEVYMIAYPETYQSSFRTGEGELAYSFLQSRFMQNFMRELQNPNKKERDAYIEERMQDPFYKNSPFLSRILEIPDLAGNMRMSVFDALRTNDGNAIPYTKLTRQQLEALKMNAFFNLQFGGKIDTAYAYFMMPIFSDSTSSAFLRFKKYTTEEAKAALVDSARQERERIEWLQSRIKPVQEEYNKWLTDQNDSNKPYKEKAKLPEQLKDIEYNMLKNGLKYQIFRDLNGGMDLSTESQFEDAVMNMIQENLNSELRSLIKEGVFDKEGNDTTGIIDERILDKKVRRENLTQYVYNTMLMNIQTLVTFGGDTAFYKAGKDGLTDFTDVYKRIKEIWSPGDYINTDAVYTHVKEGEISEIVKVRNDYKVLYVKDPGEVENIVSESIKELERVHKNNPKKDQIIKAFSELNNTDAATIIDPIRAREIHLGSKGLNASLYEMYDSLMTGKTIRHIGEEATSIVYKPFQFMFEKSTDKNNTTRFNPVQHKNAEFLMTPSMAVGNPKLEKMMEKFGYVFKKDGSWTYDSSKRITDAVMYTTAVKVGEKGTIDNIENAVETDAHTFKNANYRIQMETPEHHIDTDSMEGIQYRKLIIENVDPKTEYTLPGRDKPVKGDQLVKEFNEAIYLNVKESYEELKKLFYDEETGLPDNKKILTALREQAIEQELPDDFLTALDFLENNEGYTVDENGNLKKASQVTVLPLWHPDIVYQVESMMNSFFKNRVTKQRTDKSAGASLYNASSWGFENENPKGLRKPKIKWSKDGGIEYIEAIMPVTSEALLDYADENGFIDIKKIEEIEPDLLKGVFYRIPTEHKYSMFHIKVIGFLPQGVAGQIILPDEATKLAGLDFDIDKLYGLLYNIEVYGQPLPEKEIAYQNYINSSNFSKKLGRDIIRKNIPNFDDARARREFAAKEGLRWNADENVFTKKSLRKVESSMDTKKGRDNLKLDIAFSILSNKRTAVEQTTPGGFETLKALVDDILKAQGADKGQINPMLNSTVREIHNRMMTGLDLIGIFANHTVNHSLMTLGNVAFTKPIKFNGKELAGLSQMMVGDVNIADLKEFLAAAVDNGKDPVASFLNVTTVTSDLVAAMVRVGHPIESVMMFTANPILKEFTNRLSKAGNTYDSTMTTTISDLKSELITALRSVAGKKEADAILEKGLSPLYLNYDRKTKKGNLLDSIEKSNMSIEDLVEKKDLVEIKLRLNVINAFENWMKNQASGLKTVMSAMRYDSTNNAAGPTVAHTKNKIERYESAQKVKSLTGFMQLLRNDDANPVRYVAAFREYGLEEAIKTTSEVTKIPYASTDRFNIFNYVEKLIKDGIAPQDRTINPDDVNKIYRAIETLTATSYDTFKPADLKRVVENLPSEISNFISANEDSPYAPFLRHFMAIPSKQQKALAIMKFTRNGVDKIQQTDIKNDWYSMINDSDPNVSKIANDLVKYAFATSGYVVTPFKFTDMIPVMYTSDLREPGKKRFVESIEDIYSKNVLDYQDGSVAENMVNQIMRNMYRNFSFVKYINPDDNKPYKVNGKYRIKVWGQDVSKKVDDEVIALDYVKTVINDNQGMRSALMKISDIEGDWIVYEQEDPLGLYNEMMEFDYDSAVLNKPLVSQMESLEYIPTKEETKAKDLNISDVGVAQAMVEMMKIMPNFSINELKPVKDIKEVRTHPFIQKIKALPFEKRQQLAKLTGAEQVGGTFILDAILEKFSDIDALKMQTVEKLFEKYQEQINVKHPNTTVDTLKSIVRDWEAQGKDGVAILDQYLKKCYG